jgi:hypothetical protein
MKKCILIITITLLSFSVSSQSTEIKLGIKGGINLSKYTPEMYFGNTRLTDYKVKPGVYIGGFTNIKLSEKIYLQPELLYFNQGTRTIIEDFTLINGQDSNVTTGDIESIVSESTISLPINLQYLVSEKFYFEGGIQFGYIVNRKEETIKSPFPQIMATGSNSNYDKFDFGLNIGLGIHLKENIRINTRTFLGIIERDNSIKPLVFSLGIEYEI